MKSILNSDDLAFNKAAERLMTKGVHEEQILSDEGLELEKSVMPVVEDALPLAVIPALESFYRVVGDKIRKKHQSMPDMVRRSVRLMANETVPAMEKAESRAAMKNLETKSSSSSEGKSDLGSTLVKVLFSSYSNSNLDKLGSNISIKIDNEKS